LLSQRRRYAARGSRKSRLASDDKGGIRREHSLHAGPEPDAFTPEKETARADGQMPALRLAAVCPDALRQPHAVRGLRDAAAVVAGRRARRARGRVDRAGESAGAARVMTGVRLSDPFEVRYEVPVSGGALRVARAGPPAREADAVVLAVHGVTSSLEVWRAVARRLAGGPARVCLLAPDLRGRGRSVGLPGPYGMARHRADLIAVLDDAGAEQAVLAGHSLGGFVVAGLAAEHPERISGLVLLDGGLVVPAPLGQDVAEVLEAMIETALVRSEMTFDSVDEYVESWRMHPAFARAWDDDVAAYSRYEAGGDPGAVRLAVCQAAVRADLTDLMYDEVARTAVERVSAPIHLLRAPRGMLNDAYAVIPRPILDAFLAAQPDARVEDVADVNHYTIALGAGPGPRAVATAIEAAVQDQASSAPR
jgi:lipase